MAITSNEEANAVQLLLDYYLRGTAEVPSHAQAQAAWLTLAEASRDQLGMGWRTPDVGNLFMPRGEDGPEADQDIPDECGACLDANDDCRFHRGVLFGYDQALESAANALKVFARNPEQIGAVLDQDERNRKAEQRQQQQVRAAHRIVTDWWLGDETTPGAKYQDERNRQAQQEQQKQRDVRRIAHGSECPECASERWHDTALKVFGCTGCEYTSKTL